MPSVKRLPLTALDRATCAVPVQLALKVPPPPARSLWSRLKWPETHVQPSGQVTVTSTFAYSPLGSSVPAGAMAMVMDGEPDGGGGGFVGRLAATSRRAAMTSATASTAAMRTRGARDLVGLRIDLPPMRLPESQ